MRKEAEDMVETFVNFALLLAAVGVAIYEASRGNIAMTVYACTMLALFSLLESIERHLKRFCELLEGEGDDGED